MLTVVRLKDVWRSLISVVIVGYFRALLHTGPAQERPNPGKEFSQLKGLPDIVVAAAVQPTDDVHLIIGGGKENDGNLILFLSQRLTDLEAGAVGQCHIQKQQVV